MEDPRIISALFIFLKMAYYNVLINNKSFFREFYFLDVMQDFMDMLIRASELYHLFDLELVRIQKVCLSTHFPLTLFFLFRFVLPYINAAMLPGLNPADCFLWLLKLCFNSRAIFNL